MVKVGWLRDGDTLFELGCGDGGIVFEAARLKRIRSGACSSLCAASKIYCYKC